MIVTQVRLHQLLQKDNLSQKQRQELLKIVRDGCYSLPDVTFENAYHLLKSKSSSNDKFNHIDDLIHSGLQLKMPFETVKQYFKHFVAQVGKVPYLSRLNLFINYVYDKEIVATRFDPLMKQDVTDWETRKKMMATSKRDGQIDEFIKRLNASLEENPNDLEVWIELGQIFIERGNYLRALFCFEEVVLLCPENDYYFMKVAELYCTLGGKNNYSNAIKYYSFIVTKQPNNTRLLWGLYRALTAVEAQLEPKQQELKEKCSANLQRLYSKKNPSLKIHFGL